MDYKEIQAILKSDGFKGINVEVFLSYVKDLVTAKDKHGKLKNVWAGKIDPKLYAHVFKKVNDAGQILDGNLVTLQYRGKLLISYNYKAYKNRVLYAYPLSTFDVQLVRKEDTFQVSKESGKVVYSHGINGLWKDEQTNPIVGAYCIIKNEKGEFFESINLEDIKKMRNASKTQYIWNEWFGEMVKKSVIKRACKFHFEDLVDKMEEDDNQNYDLESSGADGISEYILQKIEEAINLDELQDIYNDESGNVADKERFFSLLEVRKGELQKELA